MSEDIVERLRSWRHDSWPADPSREAADEIERLRARVADLEDAARNYLETLGAAIKSGNFHMGGTRDMAHFVRGAMPRLDVLVFSRDEERPTGLEKLHAQIVKGQEPFQS